MPTSTSVESSRTGGNRNVEDGVHRMCHFSPITSRSGTRIIRSPQIT